MPVDTGSVDGPLGFSYDLFSSANITIDGLTIYMPISTVGSGTHTTRPKTGSLV